MPRPKGTPKTGGRKKGTVNVVTKELGGRLQDAIVNRFDKAMEMLDRVVDPEKYISFYIKLLEFRVPKMQSVALSADKSVSDLRSELDEMSKEEV